MTLKLICLFLSLVVIYLYVQAMTWRGRTEAANRKRKQIEEDAERDRDEAQNLYNARGDALKATAEKHHKAWQLYKDAEELRRRALDKIIELQRARSADLLAITGFSDKLAAADRLAKERNAQIDRLIQENRTRERQREEAEAKLVALNNDVGRLVRQLAGSEEESHAKTEIIKDLNQKIASLVWESSLIARIENVPPVTRSLTGERFRLVRYRPSTKRWVLGAQVDPKKVAAEIYNRSRLGLRGARLAPSIKAARVKSDRVKAA